MPERNSHHHRSSQCRARLHFYVSAYIVTFKPVTLSEATEDPFHCTTQIVAPVKSIISCKSDYAARVALLRFFRCCFRWFGLIFIWIQLDLLLLKLAELTLTPAITEPDQQAKVSPAAAQKTSSKKTSNGEPIHSMTALLADLTTLYLNEVTLLGLSDDILTTTTKPTSLQSRILAALNVDPTASVSIIIIG